MTGSKLHIQIGSYAFTAEGDKDWIEDQAEGFFAKIKTIQATEPRMIAGPTNQLVGNIESANPQQASILKQTLVSFLRNKNATTVQNEKFLATAAWLQLRGKKPLRSSDVSQALKDASQNRLSNPSDCMAQNIRKGLCERDGDGFFVTEEGFNALGIQGE